MKEKILIVTRDLVGPVRNGGIGTACTALAEYLVKDDKEVHILWVPGSWVEDQENDNIANWIKHYGKKGISLIPLPNPDATTYSQENYLYGMSHRIYKWCADKEYTAIIVHEWGGVGGFLAAGRKQGKVKSPVIAWCHSPTVWHVQGDQLTGTPQILDLDSLENMTMKWADAIVAPSMYLLDWIRDRGDHIPDKQFVVRNFMTEHMKEMSKPYDAESIEPVEHVIFFGRLERRKGLHTFCDAILPLMEEYDIDVTFLGKTSAMEGVDSIQWIQQKMDTASRPWRVKHDKNQPEALDIISQPRTLVVMPSEYENYPYTVMEAMTLGIPFVACATGGIPEMVQADAFLSEPNARSLREKIRDWIEDTQLVTENAVAQLENENDDNAWSWDDVFDVVSRQGESKLPADNDEGYPDVTVIITTFNRPTTLERALESACNQDYPFMEILVVDDHSSPDNKKQNEAIVENAQQWSNSEIKYVYKEQNEYLGPARNTGVEHSFSEFVVFLDDDNILNENAVTEFVNAQQNSGADVVVSPLRIFREVPENVVSDYFFSSELSAGFFHNKMGDAMSMWKATIFDHLQYTPDRAGHEDWELLVRAAIRGFRIFPMVEPIFLYQQAGDGMLLGGDPIKNIRRSMRPWFEEIYPHYTKALIYEIAFAQSRSVMMLQHQLNNLYSEHTRVVQAMEAQQQPKNQILTPDDYRRGRFG